MAKHGSYKAASPGSIPGSSIYYDIQCSWCAEYFSKQDFINHFSACLDRDWNEFTELLKARFLEIMKNFPE